jgi:hypothetical protein
MRGDFARNIDIKKMSAPMPPPPLPRLRTTRDPNRLRDPNQAALLLQRSYRARRRIRATPQPRAESAIDFTAASITKKELASKSTWSEDVLKVATDAGEFSNGVTFVSLKSGLAVVKASKQLAPEVVGKRLVDAMKVRGPVSLCN